MKLVYAAMVLILLIFLTVAEAVRRDTIRTSVLSSMALRDEIFKDDFARAFCWENAGVTIDCDGKPQCTDKWGRSKNKKICKKLAN